MVEIGETIAGRYQLRRRLGQGPLAEVFLAYDERLHSLFALKLLRQDLAADPAFLKRFRQMLASTPALEHAHLVGCHGLEQTRDHAFLIMDYVAGLDLGAYLQQHPGPAPYPEAMLIWRAASAAVQHLHTRGAWHGHLVPANVLLGQEGQVRVSDAGIALLAQQATDSAPAPKPTARQDDIRDLAALLYLLLTGSAPQATAAPPSAVQSLLDLSPQAEAALMRGLSPDPTQRPATAQQLYSQVLARELEEEYPPSPMIAALVRPDQASESSSPSDLRGAAKKILAFLAADVAREPPPPPAEPTPPPAAPAVPPPTQPARQYTVGWSQLAEEKERLQARLREAGAALVEGRWQAALDICEEILSRFPGHIAAQTLAAEAAAARALADRESPPPEQGSVP